MSLFNLFKKRKRSESPDASPISGYAFTDDDRAKSAEIRQLRLQAKEEELRANIAMQRRFFNDSTKTRPEDMLMNVLLAKFSSTGFTPQQVEPSKESIHFTDEELTQMIKQFDKKQVEAAVKMGKPILKKIILSKLPNVADESLERAFDMAYNMVTGKPGAK